MEKENKDKTKRVLGIYQKLIKHRCTRGTNKIK